MKFDGFLMKQILFNSELNIKDEFYFQWHITDLCNLRCKHCYHSDYQFRGIEISKLLCIASHVCDAIRQWGKIGSFSLTGGEPFLRKEDVFQLLDFFECHDEVGYVDILTNGTLIDQQIVQNLTKYRKLRRIQISLEGLREANDNIRGTGSFDLIMSKIEQLHRNNLKTSVMMTVGKHNIYDVISLAEKLGDYGVEAFITDRFIPEGQSGCLGEWVLSPFELRNLYERCYDRFLGSNRPKMLLYRTLFCLLNPEAEHIGAICSAGNNALTIMPNGDVFPCRRLPLKLGNLLETTIYDIWYTNPILWDLRNPDNLKGKCNGCEYISLCRGCRAMAYSLTGDYMEADPQCWR